MLTLSSDLTAAMTSLNKTPLFKVVLSRAAQSTRAYDSSRVLKISRTVTPSGESAEINLQNYDNALTALNFEHYQAVISRGFATGVARSAWVAASAYAVDAIRVPVTANGYQYRCSVAGTSAATEPTWPTTLGITVADSAVTWEMDGNTGDEYARASPLRVRAQELHSGRGILRCILRPEGILDQLAEDKAESVYTQLPGDTQTCKTLLTAVAGTTLAPYSNYTAYTVTYDSEDTLLDTFIPADFFSIQLNENRRDKAQELLDYTGSKMRTQNDGNIHVLDPVTTGTAYSYEYQFNVSAQHNFFNKVVRFRFVEPNKEVVTSPSSHSPSYSGSATSATSYDLAPKIHTTEVRLASTAVANSIASAKIERYELDAETGFVVAPLNVGQELWDYIKVTDSRSGDTRIGNVQFIQEDIEVHLDRRPLTWQTMLSFGKVTQQSLSQAMLYMGEETKVESEVMSNAQLQASLYQMLDMIDILDDKTDSMQGIMTLMYRLINIPKKAVIGTLVEGGATTLGTGDAKNGNYFRIPAAFNNWKIISVAANVFTAGTTGTTDIQLRNVTDAVDVLSTKLTIDSTEKDSKDAATAAVINTANNAVATGDQFTWDVDAVQTTAPKGLWCEVTLQEA